MKAMASGCTKCRTAERPSTKPRGHAIAPLDSLPTQIPLDETSPPQAPPKKPSRIRAALVAIIPPLIVFGLVRGWLLFITREAGKSTDSSSTFIQWDAHLYLDIARKGYDLFHCTRRE